MGLFHTKRIARDASNHIDVIAHAHPEGGYFNLEVDLAVSTDFILIDISDTVNYPHENTDSIHLAWLLVGVDASATANYDISIGFLENVDGTNGDYHEVFRTSGSKNVGQNKFDLLRTAPDGPWCKSSKTVSSLINTDVAAFNTGTNLKTTRSPGSIATPSGDRDLILRVTMTAGSIMLNVSGNYHSHTA